VLAAPSGLARIEALYPEDGRARAKQHNQHGSLPQGLARAPDRHNQRYSND
jgi:hypothetical protein